MNNLKIIHWDSNGFSLKMNEHHALATKHKIDIILLSETHLKSTLILKLPNDHSYRTDLPPIRVSPARSSRTAVLVYRRITHILTKLKTSIQSTDISSKINNQTKIDPHSLQIFKQP